MKQVITEYLFTEAFKDAGRKDQFSYAGLKALFAHIEQLEDDIGEETELDVIALCCDYAECSIEEFRSMYSLTPEDNTLEWANDQLTQPLSLPLAIPTAGNRAIQNAVRALDEVVLTIIRERRVSGQEGADLLGAADGRPRRGQRRRHGRPPAPR